MAGQVIKRGDDTWLVRVFTGRDAKGKRRYFNKTVHGTKKEAEKYLTAKLRERDLGVFVESSRETLGCYLDRWLEAVAKPRVRENTYASYKEWLERYVRHTLGETKMCDLRATHIQSVY